MKHTKGPWYLTTSNCITTDNINHYSALIPIISPWQEDACDDNEEAKANMKLIAAAPELLKACLMLLEEYKDVEMNTPIAYYKVIKAAEEAIKKATD